MMSMLRNARLETSTLKNVLNVDCGKGPRPPKIAAIDPSSIKMPLICINRKKGDRNRMRLTAMLKFALMIPITFVSASEHGRQRLVSK